MKLGVVRRKWLGEHRVQNHERLAAAVLG